MLLSFSLENIGKTNKNHEFLIFLHHSLKIIFLVFIGFPMFLNFLHRISWFLLVFPMFLSSRIYKIFEKQRNFNFLIYFEFGIRS